MAVPRDLKPCHTGFDASTTSIVGLFMASFERVEATTLAPCALPELRSYAG